MSKEIRKVSNPIRAKILEILAKRGEVRVLELRDLLGISTGSLYYHIDVLGDLVKRERGVLKLTEKGWIVYKEISSLNIAGSIKDTIFVSKPMLIISIVFSIIGLYNFLMRSHSMILCIYPVPLKFGELTKAIQPLLLLGVTLLLAFVVTRRIILREYLIAVPYILSTTVILTPYYFLEGRTAYLILPLLLTITVVYLSLALSKVIGMRIERGFLIGLATVYTAIIIGIIIKSL